MALVTLKDILETASVNQYAVGMFDVHNLEMTRAVIGAAEEEGSPVILALAEIHAPSQRILGEIGSMMLHCAMFASVPVAVHLDHATSMDVIGQALDLGFTSVMYDGSALPLEENIENSRKAVRLARKKGACVEAELGHVGGNEGTGGGNPDILYTDIREAAGFVEVTDIDALAVSIGTVHGVYRAAPQLNFSLLRQLHESVPVPLVLHGGSGLSDDDMINCIHGGISKINIYTELIQAAKMSLDTYMPSMDYPGVMGRSVEDMQGIARERIRLFKQCSQAVL